MRVYFKFALLYIWLTIELKSESFIQQFNVVFEMHNPIFKY